MTTTAAQSRTDYRCQRCARTGLTFLHEGELEFWGYDPSEQRWLCAAHWSDRENAIMADQPYPTPYSPFPSDPATPSAAITITTTED